MIETNDVSLNSAINVLTIDGIEIFSACGSVMKDPFVSSNQGLMPSQPRPDPLELLPDRPERLPRYKLIGTW